jgi:hypothetical protein
LSDTANELSDADVDLMIHHQLLEPFPHVETHKVEWLRLFSVPEKQVLHETPSQTILRFTRRRAITHTPDFNCYWDDLIKSTSRR